MGPNTYYILAVVIGIFGFGLNFLGYRSKVILDEKANNEKIALIYQRFTEGKVRDARSVVWREVLGRYFKDRSYANKIIYYSNDRMNLLKFSETAKTEEDAKEEARQYCISDLIDFYCYIYRLHSGDKDRLEQACNQYFYHWWRGFLLSYALMSHKKWKDLCENAEMEERFPFNVNLATILKLDIETMKFTFDPKNDLYYRDFENIEEMYPGLDDHNFKLMQYNRYGLFMRKLTES